MTLNVDSEEIIAGTRAVHGRGAVLVADTPSAYRIDFRELTAWVLLILGVTYWANVVRSNDTGEALSLVTVANSIISEGAFNVLAWFVIFENVSAASPNARASGRQLCQALLTGAVCIVPTKQATAVAMLAFGTILYRRSKPDLHIRRIALVLLALAFEIFWTSHYLDVFHVAVGRIDAHAVAAIYQAFGHGAIAHGNVIEDAGGLFGVVVVAGCSSSYTLASICLAFVVTAMFRQRNLRRSALGWLAAAYLASIVLTELRLMLTMDSAESYEWWHNGPGFPIYSLAVTASVAFFAIMATREAPAEPELNRNDVN